MANFSTTNPINTNGVSAIPGESNRALGLKLFKNDVIRAFDNKNVALSLVTTKSISGGVSEQFIVTGKADEADVGTHTPGTDISASVLKTNERTIVIKDRKYYSTFVDQLDEKLAQYDIRSELSKQSAEVLSTIVDKDIFVEVGKCFNPATSGAVANNQDEASISHTVDYLNADTKIAGDAIVGSIFELNSDFNKKNVPMDGRVFVTNPDNYYKIVQSTNAVNTDYTQGNGGIDMGTVYKIAGTPIIWTNNLPSTVDAGATPTVSEVGGYLIRKGCVGVLTAMEIQSEANYIPEKLGSLLTSFYALGMDILNPAEAGLMTKDTVA